MATMREAYDYSEFEADIQSDEDLLTRISRLALEQRRAEISVAEAEEAVRDAKKHLHRISRDLLPAALDQAHQRELTTREGLLVSLVDKTETSLPEERREAGHEWLEKNGHGVLIKRRFEILFNRDEEAWAKKFMRDLLQRKRQLNVSIKKWVEPATLNKLVRDTYEAGGVVPEELFGVFRYKEAKIKAQK